MCREFFCLSILVLLVLPVAGANEGEAPEEQFKLGELGEGAQGELWTKSGEQWVRQDSQLDQWIYKVMIPEVLDGVRGQLLRGTGPDRSEVEAFLPDAGSGKREVRVREKNQAEWSPWHTAGQARPLWPLEAKAKAVGTVHPARQGQGYDGSRRDWTDLAGRTITGSVTDADASGVTLRKDGGPPVRIPYQMLIPEDRIILLKWLESRPFTYLGPAEAGVSIAEGMGIQKVAAGIGKEARGYAYETAHFAFLSAVPLNQNHLHEVGVTFEAVRMFSLKMPWGINFPAEARERFRARLFDNEAAYYAGGGRPGTGGLFSLEKNEFLLPFQSIGLKPSGEAVKKTGMINRTVLQHELMHQMMQDMLPWLPMWIIEGSAEFAGQLPMTRGKLPSKLAPKDILRYVSALPADQAYYHLGKTAQWTVWPEEGTQLPAPGEKLKIGLPLLYSSSFILFVYHMQMESDPSKILRCFAAARRLKLESDLALAEMNSYLDALKARHMLLLANQAVIGQFNKRVQLYNQSLSGGDAGKFTAPPEPVWIWPGPGPEKPRLWGDMKELYAAELAGLPHPQPWTIPRKEPEKDPSARPPPPWREPQIITGQRPPSSELREAIVFTTERFLQKDGRFIRSLDSPRNQLIRRTMGSILGPQESLPEIIVAAFKKSGVKLPAAVQD